MPLLANSQASIVSVSRERNAGYDSDDEEDRDAEDNKKDPLYPAKNWRPTRAVREVGEHKLLTRNLESFRHKYNCYYVKTGNLQIPAGGSAGTTISELTGTYSRAMNYNADDFVDTYVVLDCVVTLKTTFRVIILDVCVDDSGRYCLWPFKSGPTSESPWEYADMYKIKGLLPLNESTVVNYKEYEIKKYCFLGTIGQREICFRSCSTLLNLDHLLEAYKKTFCKKLVNGTADSDGSASKAGTGARKKRNINLKTDENGIPLVKSIRGPYIKKNKPSSGSNPMEDDGDVEQRKENQVPVNNKFNLNTVPVGNRKNNKAYSKPKVASSAAISITEIKKQVPSPVSDEVILNNGGKVNTFKTPEQQVIETNKTRSMLEKQTDVSRPLLMSSSSSLLSSTVVHQQTDAYDTERDDEQLFGDDTDTTDAAFSPTPPPTLIKQVDVTDDAELDGARVEGMEPGLALEQLVTVQVPHHHQQENNGTGGDNDYYNQNLDDGEYANNPGLIGYSGEYNNIGSNSDGGFLRARAAASAAAGNPQQLTPPPPPPPSQPQPSQRDELSRPRYVIHQYTNLTDLDKYTKEELVEIIKAKDMEIARMLSQGIVSLKEDIGKILENTNKISDMSNAVQKTRESVEMYIARINEVPETLDNPFALNALPFPTDSFLDFQNWEHRMNPNNFEKVEDFIIEATLKVRRCEAVFRKEYCYTSIE